MSFVTTHVLNTGAGEPARGVPVVLKFREACTQPWAILGHGTTDANGRLQDILPPDYPAKPGLYCLSFDSASLSQFFPEVSVHFAVSDPQQHYHIPVLLSEFGYTTYRGT
jgi:5-hydroxyisourate hydrolase